MYRQLYSLVFDLATPLVVGRLVKKMSRSAQYRQGISNRFALSFAELKHKMQKKPTIWLHAVSVGEVLASVPIVNEMIKRYPEYQVVVTTTTPTGADRVKQHWPESVIHCYLPYDYAWAMRKFVSVLQPSVLLIMETELWPNMLHYTHKAGAPILLLNARLSIKSAKGYTRFKPLVKSMLKQLSCVAVQAPADGDRLLQLGLKSSQLKVTGSVKYDVEIPVELVAQGEQIKSQLSRPVWVAASTREGEETAVLAAYRKLKEQVSDLLLVLVPRHPERFSEVYELIQKQGYTAHSRSRDKQPSRETDVFLGDSMGEMWFYFGMGSVAYVGGSLVPTGGHNVLEPIALELPVVVGPNMFNFQHVFDQLVEAQGIRVVEDDTQLANAIRMLLTDDTVYQVQRNGANKVYHRNKGALVKMCDLIEQQLKRLG